MLIDLHDISDKYVKECTGVIHVGAHTAEELGAYKAEGWDVLWIEANEELAERLEERGLKVVNVAISDRSGYVKFNQMSLTGSSSILEPGLNVTWRNDLRKTGEIQVKSESLKTYQTGQNFLNLDIQGAELLALKGCDLSQIDYIYTEVHKVETYKNCPMIWELDEYLKDFVRVETKWTHREWGDALYIRHDLHNIVSKKR